MTSFLGYYKCPLTLLSDFTVASSQLLVLVYSRHSSLLKPKDSLKIKGYVFSTFFPSTPEQKPHPSSPYYLFDLSYRLLLVSLIVLVSRLSLDHTKPTFVSGLLHLLYSVRNAFLPSKSLIVFSLTPSVLCSDVTSSKRSSFLTLLKMVPPPFTLLHCSTLILSLPHVIFVYYLTPPSTMTASFLFTAMSPKPRIVWGTLLDALKVSVVWTNDSLQRGKQHCKGHWSPFRCSIQDNIHGVSFPAMAKDLESSKMN